MDGQCYYLLLLYTGAKLSPDVLECSLQPSEGSQPLQEETMGQKRMFEVYLYADQDEKRGFGGHVRFVAAAGEPEARNAVSFSWGHWWRTCGIREVDMTYWCDTHSSLPRGGAARAHSVEAYESVFGEKLAGG